MIWQQHAARLTTSSSTLRFTMNRRFIIIYLTLLVCIVHLQVRPLWARTIDDNLNDMRKGSGKVLLGAYLREVEIIRKGMSEEGSVSAVMTPFLGEEVLEIGKAFVDFPAAPAVHISIFMGGKTGSEAAFFLMLRGANVSKYYLEPDGTDTDYFLSYPPAMLYALGMGQPPRKSHAGLLERVHQSIGGHLPGANFNIAAVDGWNLLTGSPPIVHIPLLANYFDGIYVLAMEFKADLNAPDAMNVTALHISAWMGDSNVCKFLLYQHADPFRVDKHNRTALHYASMRGHNHIIADLLYPNLKDLNLTTHEALSRRKTLLSMVDGDRLTALELASVYPPLQLTAQYLQFETEKLNSQGGKEYGGSVDSRIRRTPRDAAAHRKLTTLLPGRQLDDQSRLEPAHTRGGWDYSKVVRNDRRVPLVCTVSSQASRADSDEERQSNAGNDPRLSPSDGDCPTIDIVSAAKLKKGVFRRDYFSKQRPVLITDSLTARQGIWGYWQKTEFLGRYGGMNVTYGERYHTGSHAWLLPKTETITLSEYVARFLGKSGMPVCHGDGPGAGSCAATEAPVVPFTTPWVGVNERAVAGPFATSWRLDVHKPSLFKLCTPSDKDDEPLKLYVGGRGSGVPMHAHAASWNLLLAGVKRWFFAAPGHTADEVVGLPVEGTHQQHVRTTERWLAEVAPDLVESGAVVEVVQYPGDVVFVPHDWWHATLNDADAVSVSQVREGAGNIDKHRPTCLEATCG